MFKLKVVESHIQTKAELTGRVMSKREGGELESSSSGD